MFLSKLMGGGGRRGNLQRNNSKDSSSGDNHSELSSPKGVSRTGSQRSTLIGSPLSSPVNTFIVAKNDHSKLGTTVRQILDSPVIAIRFKEYAASLHADEGLLFLDDLQQVHESSDPVASAEMLMTKYFIDDAENQVNLPDSIRSELLDRYHNKKYADLDELFTEAIYEVFTDIKKSDTFRNFLQIDEEAKRISSDETLLLDGWLGTENFRIALHAIADDSNLANLVRFCTSVSEYEKEDDKTARKARGNKISATFIQTGSTFQINLPAYYVDAILKGRYQILADARIESLQELANHQGLMEAVRRSLTEIRSSVACSRDYSVSSRTQELQRVFATKMGKKFVQRLQEQGMEQTDPATLNKARFCSAVASFMSVPGTCDSSTEKLGMARKIVANFIQVGSMFQVELATGFVEDLCKSKHPDYVTLLSVVHHQFVSDIGAVPLVGDVLDSFELEQKTQQ